MSCHYSACERACRTISTKMFRVSADFPMPALIAIGPEQMLERAKANGPMVPMSGYKIYIYGATRAASHLRLGPL